MTIPLKKHKIPHNTSHWLSFTVALSFVLVYWKSKKLPPTPELSALVSVLVTATRAIFELNLQEQKIQSPKYRILLYRAGNDCDDNVTATIVARSCWRRNS